MFLLLDAASAGIAHILLGADRLFILLAVGALRRCGGDSFRASLWWTLGHLMALFVEGGHIFTWWRDVVEWNMYISGITLVVFGLHIAFWQHLYSDVDREWGDLGLGICSSKQISATDSSLKRFGSLLESYRSLPNFAVCLPECSIAAAIFLGFLQGLISPDFAFAGGSAWVEQAIPRTFLWAAFCFGFASSAALVSLFSWRIFSSEPRSARGHRSARRTIGVCLFGVGFLWLLLVLQLNLEIAAASHHGAAAMASAPSAAARRPGLGASDAVAQCPLLVTIDGVSFDSAPTWEMVEKLDPWWTRQLLEEHRKPPFRYSIRPSLLGGCGVQAEEDLPAGAGVGLAGILSGPWDYSASLVHVTPWLGIAVNHCGKGNAHLRRQGSLLILETTRAVTKGQEITFDYDSAADTIPIERAQPNWTC